MYSILMQLYCCFKLKIAKLNSFLITSKTVPPWGLGGYSGLFGAINSLYRLAFFLILSISPAD